MDDDARALSRLIHEGLSIDATDSSGAPLIFFCVEGRHSCLALLLSLGANPAQACPDGSTPSMRAARTCPVSFAALLRARAPWLDVDKHGNNTLHQGSMAQSPHGLLALRSACELAPSSCVDAVNHHGFTPLAVACRIDNDDALRVLLPRSNPLALNPLTGRSPLAYCIENDRPRCALILWGISGATSQRVDGYSMLKWAQRHSSEHKTPWPWLGLKIAQAERDELGDMLPPPLGADSDSSSRSSGRL
jgi:ankyrin repeat protein